MIKTQKQKEKENRLVGRLSEMSRQFKAGHMSEALILSYFSQFMTDADVDSDITVNVLEQFGEAGKSEAMIIKVNEGW